MFHREGFSGPARLDGCGKDLAPTFSTVFVPDSFGAVNGIGMPS
jgi:hypothetical protein